MPLTFERRARLNDPPRRRNAPTSLNRCATPCADAGAVRSAAPVANHQFANVSVGASDGVAALANSGQAISAQAPTTSPSPAPACANPGDIRAVDLQPVFFKSSATDASPTGGSWARRLRSSNTIWGKLGVTFSALSTIEKVDATNKTAGATTAEFHAVRATQTGAGVEVFMVDNAMSTFGGGGTVLGGSSSAQIVLSDRGTSDTLLAHELGHVLGLGHPPSKGDPGTIMAPSGSHSSANPTKNTMANYRRITWPSGSGSTCLTPDP